MTTIAFILWPLVSLLFFRAFTVPAAVAATIIGGYLLLPVRGGFDLPLLPAVDKTFVPSVAALLLAIAFGNQASDKRPGWVPRSRVVLFLIALLVLGAFGTVLTNAESIRIGDRILSGMRSYDAMSITMNTLVGLIPFLLARKFLATAESHRTLLIVLVVAGFGYSLLALYEIRMSPQLNRMIYGFFPHSFAQHMRGGGFRPVVFLNHALWLAIFLACCTIAAFALWRIGRSKWRKAYLVAGLWLVMTLILAKSFGAIFITFALVPVVLLLPSRMQILTAAALAATLTLYPVVRASGFFPIDTVVSTLGKIAPERIGSLEFRLRHEDILLAKAQERPLFGWGGYGRNRVYDESGRDISVTDGKWIIQFSVAGWVGYVGEFGLLTFAVFVLALRWRRYELDPATAALSVVLAANLVDLIPNATLSSVTLMLAGALTGRLEVLTQRSKEEVAALSPGGDSRSTATSFLTTRPRSKASEGRAAATERPGTPFTRFAPRPGRTK